MMKTITIECSKDQKWLNNSTYYMAITSGRIHNEVNSFVKLLFGVENLEEIIICGGIYKENNTISYLLTDNQSTLYRITSGASEFVDSTTIGMGLYTLVKESNDLKDTNEILNKNIIEKDKEIELLNNLLSLKDIEMKEKAKNRNLMLDKDIIFLKDRMKNQEELLKKIAIIVLTNK